mmetsp:Transcript_7079/g.12650  ORF Transcript_7079/g.12650 Transcript_7079/m.12650 type:complete len:542 (-) Transcript_7079:70-1695(-)
MSADPKLVLLSPRDTVTPHAGRASSGVDFSGPGQFPHSVGSPSSAAGSRMLFSPRTTRSMETPTSTVVQTSASRSQDVPNSATRRSKHSDERSQLLQQPPAGSQTQRPAIQSKQRGYAGLGRGPSSAQEAAAKFLKQDPEPLFITAMRPLRRRQKQPKAKAEAANRSKHAPGLQVQVPTTSSATPKQTMRTQMLAQSQPQMHLQRKQQVVVISLSSPSEREPAGPRKAADSSCLTPRMQVQQTDSNMRNRHAAGCSVDLQAVSAPSSPTPQRHGRVISVRSGSVTPQVPQRCPSSPDAPMQTHHSSGYLGTVQGALVHSPRADLPSEAALRSLHPQAFPVQEHSSAVTPRADLPRSAQAWSVERTQALPLVLPPWPTAAWTSTNASQAGSAMMRQVSAGSWTSRTGFSTPRVQSFHTTGSFGLQSMTPRAALHQSSSFGGVSSAAPVFQIDLQRSVWEARGRAAAKAAPQWQPEAQRSAQARMEVRPPSPEDANVDDASEPEEKDAEEDLSPKIARQREDGRLMTAERQELSGKMMGTVGL